MDHNKKTSTIKIYSILQESDDQCGIHFDFFVIFLFYNVFARK